MPVFRNQGFARDNTPTVPVSETGDCYFSGIGGDTIDYSFADDAYLMIKKESDTTCKIRMTHVDTDEQFVYTFKENGKWQILPVQKPGEWFVEILSHLEGKEYDIGAAEYIEADFDNEFLPFLRPSLICAYTEDSLSTGVAYELSKSAATDEDVVNGILNYFARSNFTYTLTYEKAEDIKYSDSQSADNVLISNSGVCSDFSALAAAMLRSQGIPTKVVHGYGPRGIYHAWISVYIDNQWKHFDPTATVKSGSPCKIGVGDDTGDWREICYY